MKVAIVVGTRPEIIKMAPVLRAAQLANHVEPLLWHTGQHYSFEMDQQMFTDLELPEPDSKLNTGSATHAVQTGNIMAGLESIMAAQKPDAVLVQGDTNTVLGASLAAVKLHIPLCHVEAGLRSYDRTMPEEINRIACDHIADVLYPPTEAAAGILQNEGIHPTKIVVTGNTAVDSAMQSLELAAQHAAIADKLPKNRFIFFTMHRAENVDDKHKLMNVIQAMNKLLGDFPQMHVVWPIHPRTQKQLESFELSHLITSNRRIIVLQPIGYLDTLLLESRAELIMTDSGGIQEEACILGTPCLTLRENTGRPESVEVGANELVGTSLKAIVSKASLHLKKGKTANWNNPFGDGKAGERIIQDIIKRFAPNKQQAMLNYPQYG